MSSENDHFNKIFWFIVFLTAFGMGFTIWTLIRFTGETAERFADQAIIFWLTSAVGGGIGYLIGSSVTRIQPKATSAPGTTTADISATITTETEKPTDEKTDLVKEDKENEQV